jgi:D-alanine-D-alanine ligase-like ATP-grasp enzyme
LRPDGALYALEANANPNLSEGEDFAQSALTAGMKYADVLHRLLKLGADYPAAWRGVDS